MADGMQSKVTDEDVVIHRMNEAVNEVVNNNIDMPEAKNRLRAVWQQIPEDRQKEIANRLFSRLSRMETVVQSLVAEFSIMSINQRT